MQKMYELFPENQIDHTKLKYVLYARKSTDDARNQTRSIDDQIADCKEFALRNNIKIVGKPLIEKKSAKIPDQRPVFNQILKDLKANKYDGILSWHPDRLARNMGEGGKIIDMIDAGEILDLKFVAHHFSNDPNGKMLLGLAFVLSKQYSDDLSQKITRGNRRSFEEGRSWTPKFGYVVDTYIYRPDGRNFELIKEAWEMRVEGKPLEVISDHLNQQGFYKLAKTSGRKIRISIQKLSQMFKDPFYYGVLVQANRSKDLREAYDFEPAVSEEAFNRVQALSYKKGHHSKRRLIPYPLSDMMFCSLCGEPCSYGATRSHTGERYLRYWCRNKECEIKNKDRGKKSVRAIVVFNFISDFFDKHLKFTKREYEQYCREMEDMSDEIKQKVRTELHSKEGALKAVKADIHRISLGMAQMDSEGRVWKENNDRVAELSQQETKLLKEVEKLKQKIGSPKEDRLTVQSFLNLSRNASKKLKAGDAMQKDLLARLVFLNLSIDGEKVVSYTLKEPFKALVGLRADRKLSKRGHGEN